MTRRGHKNSKRLPTRLPTTGERAMFLCMELGGLCIIPANCFPIHRAIERALRAHARDTLARAKRRRHEYVIGPMVTGTLDEGGGLVITGIDSEWGVITCEAAKRKAGQ